MAHLRDPKLLKQIAARIRDLRMDKGVTLEAFYHDTGIHLARIESSQGNVTVSTLNSICKYFGLSLQEFFKGIN
jgi:transcriptional regulator with XRE-family HTH domain